MDRVRNGWTGAWNPKCHDGSTFACSLAVISAYASTFGASTLGVFPQLTPAERLVAIHLVEGFSNKEIAALLGKAEPTVKHQVSSILRSAKVQSRCRFIAVYYQQCSCSPLMDATRNSTSIRGDVIPPR